MGLIDQDRVVGQQHRIALGLGEQNTVGHQFDGHARTGAVVEPNLITHHRFRLIAADRPEFLRDPFGHGDGRQPARLGVANGLAALPPTERQRDLRQLGGLARTGLTADDHHRMFLDRPSDLVPAGADREGFRKLNMHQENYNQPMKTSALAKTAVRPDTAPDAPTSGMSEEGESST